MILCPIIIMILCPIIMILCPIIMIVPGSAGGTGRGDIGWISREPPLALRIIEAV